MACQGCGASPWIASPYRKVSFLVAAGLALMLIGCANPHPSATDTSTISTEGDRWNSAYAAGDWKALRGLYADDAWLMTNNAPVAKGADAIVAYLRRFRERGAVAKFRFSPEDIRVDRPYAFMIAKYWMTAQTGQRETLRSAGRSLLIYQWRKGSWKLWRDIDNSTPDVVPEVATFGKRT